MSSAFYQVLHDTHYRYSAPVSLAQQLAHLWPRECPWQRCHEQELRIDPQPCLRRDGLDVFGNPLTRLVFERPHEQLSVSARLRVEVLARPALDLDDSPNWEAACAALSYSGKPMEPALLEAARYRFESPYVRLKQVFADFADDCFTSGRPLLQAGQALMQKIFEEFSFDAGATQVATPLLQVLEEKRGVCQDFAHLMLACLRSRGLAARYVSGYLLTQPPPGQPRLIGADASHAWISLYCPCQGWVDFDPTNNVRPALEHITLAWGRDFSDVSPLRGVILGGGSHDPDVQVTVLPLG
ncbi:transglutaminase family protein [Pseudomonas mendocina]|nr:transglutaminase family protein [Pseudomonas mendocina]MDV5862926.1 transglutaminase family protein [Pseudomonas mendocina]WGL61913.1 transglutaminase family protein [Pseudomonas sp. CW003PS]